MTTSDYAQATTEHDQATDGLLDLGAVLVVLLATVSGVAACLGFLALAVR